MAAQLVTRINRYIGTAAEIAAMTLTDIPTGSTFFESDTGILKILNAAGALVEAPSESVQLSGSIVEQASAQDTQVATTAKTYTKAAGASQMEVYCEAGYIRVRTDGEACTSTTGEPIAAGFGSGWQADSISVYFIQESVITVVSR